MRISTVTIRVKERSDLLPLLIGMMQFSQINFKGSINSPDYIDGYYQVKIERDVPDDQENMILTYEHGSVERIDIAA